MLVPLLLLLEEGDADAWAFAISLGITLGSALVMLLVSHQVELGWHSTGERCVSVVEQIQPAFWLSISC